MTNDTEDYGPIEYIAPSTKTAALSEREIFDCLKTNLSLAVDRCRRLGNGERGHLYVEFTQAMKLVEGACRQGGHWREDARWFPFGLKIAEAQKKCGNWLREKSPGWKFKALAEILAYGLQEAEVLQHNRTGRVGMILPKPQRTETRTEGRPVQVILPPGFERKPTEALN